MKTELKANEMEQVNGGNFIDCLKGALKIAFPNPYEPVIGRGKC